MAKSLEGHPTSWVGKSFKSVATGEIERVLKVEKNHSRYSVKIDNDNDFMRYMGYDSRVFKRCWEAVPE